MAHKTQSLTQKRERFPNLNKTREFFTSIVSQTYWFCRTMKREKTIPSKESTLTTKSMTVSFQSMRRPQTSFKEYKSNNAPRVILVLEVISSTSPKISKSSLTETPSCLLRNLQWKKASLEEKVKFKNFRKIKISISLTSWNKMIHP